VSVTRKLIKHGRVVMWVRLTPASDFSLVSHSLGKKSHFLTWVTQQ